jgi:hypothetical protein
MARNQSIYDIFIVHCNLCADAHGCHVLGHKAAVLGRTLWKFAAADDCKRVSISLNYHAGWVRWPLTFLKGYATHNKHA